METLVTLITVLKHVKQQTHFAALTKQLKQRFHHILHGTDFITINLATTVPKIKFFVF